MYLAITYHPSKFQLTALIGGRETTSGKRGEFAYLGHKTGSKGPRGLGFQS